MHLAAALLALALALPAAPTPAQQAQLFTEDHAALPWDDGLSLQILIGRFDADASPDVLLFGPETARLLRGQGSGAFSEAPGFDALGGAARSAATADLDGDGDLDVVTGDTDGARLFLGDGAGSFAEAPGMLEPSIQTHGIALGDVDGDGDTDAFFAQRGFSGGDFQNALFRNEGAAVFTSVTATALPQTADPSTDAELGDLDGDGNLDVFVTNGTSFGAVADYWLRGDGAGAFTQAGSFVPEFGNDAALGDVDGDGDLDVFVANAFANQLFLNDGAGAFVDASTRIPGDAVLTYSVLLADLDDDADLDAVLGTGAQLENRVYANDGGGTFTDTLQPFGGSFALPVRDVAVGDVDLDGDQDLAFAAYGRQSIVFLGDGELRFGVGRRGLPLDSIDTTDLVTGDVDGDGDLDVVATGGTQVVVASGEAVLFENLGFGEFSYEDAALTQLERDFLAADLGDLDGDGDLDLALIAGYQDSASVFLRNQGDGTFVDVTAETPGETADGREVAFGDADGDGDLDLYIGVVGGGADRYWLNDGDGGFVDAPAGYAVNPFYSTYLFVWHDLDADGVLEALVGGPGSSILHLYENDGSGVLTDETARLGGSYSDVDGLAVGDFDGDLDPDVVVASSTSFERLLVNDGAGGFESALPFGSHMARSVAAADVDLDGDLDVVFGGQEDAALYRNDGAGAMTFAPDAFGGYRPICHALALDDFDRDGDVDALFGNSGPTNRLWLNRTRHLAWRAPANLGKPQVFDVHGPPSEAWLVAFSTGQGALALPPHGLLVIDPGAFLIVASGALDGAGQAVFVGSVPNVPALAGGTYFWQALVGTAAPKLTNGQATTVSAF